MAVIKVPTTFNIDLEFEIPEFYRRMVAVIIDYLICICYLYIGVAVYDSIERNSGHWDIDTAYNLQTLRILILTLPPLIYHIILEITMNGQSVGKRIMGMRVVTENGGRASISQFLIRWLLRDIWFLTLFAIGANMIEEGSRTEGTIMMFLVLAYFIVEIVLVVSNQKSQRIGDLLAHTILIKTNAKASIEETVFQEVSDTYTPSFPQIMQLSDRDINAIKSILETARKKGDDNMAYAASEKIKTHLKIDTKMPPFQFLDLLLKDYNYLSTK